MTTTLQQPVNRLDRVRQRLDQQVNRLAEMEQHQAGGTIRVRPNARPAAGPARRRRMSRRDLAVLILFGGVILASGAYIYAQYDHYILRSHVKNTTFLDSDGRPMSEQAFLELYGPNLDMPAPVPARSPVPE